MYCWNTNFSGIPWRKTNESNLGTTKIITFNEVFVFI